jgi:D-alanyl-D-alanine carboxypeptidase
MASPAATPSRRPSRRAIGVVVAILAGASVLGVGTLRGVAGDGPAATATAPAGSVPFASQVAVGSPVSSSTAPSTEPSPSPSPTAAPPTGPTADRRAAMTAARLSAELDRIRRQLRIPGAQATILFADGTSWTGVSGLADVAAKRPVGADTAFAIASVSKTFTSALILELADEGKLALTDRAATLLPPLRLRLDPRITVAMLLNHTSGLADYFLNPKIDAPLQRAPTVAWTVDRTLRYVGKPLGPPGKAFHYSNTNYLLLGLIAEHLTGRPYAELVRTRLLDPTGLGTTWIQTGEPARAPLAHGYRFAGTQRTAKPIDLADGSGIAPFRSVVTAAGAAGSVASTSGDLARWARALYTGRVLGPTGTGTLLAGFTPTAGYVPGVVYGYGVQALSIAGHPSLGHSGRLRGFRSAVRHVPIDGITIAVLINDGRDDPGVIVARLLAIALPVAPACPICFSAR